MWFKRIQGKGKKEITNMWFRRIQGKRKKEDTNMWFTRIQGEEGYTPCGLDGYKIKEREYKYVVKNETLIFILSSIEQEKNTFIYGQNA